MEAHSVSVQCLHGWSLIIKPNLVITAESPEAPGVRLWCHAPLWSPIVPHPQPPVKCIKAIFMVICGPCARLAGTMAPSWCLRCPPSPSLVSSDPQTGLKAVSPLSLTNSLDLPLYSFCLRATSLQIRCLVTEPGAAWPNYCSLWPILVLIRSWSDTSRQMTNKHRPDALRVEIYWYWLSWLIKIKECTMKLSLVGPRKMQLSW